jgi:type II secretory pathway component PulJ
MSGDQGGTTLAGSYVRRANVRSLAGVTLVELLVAACVSTLALAGAWAWLWSAGMTAGDTAARAQAASVAAFAVRSIANDLGLATALSCPPAGMSPDSALCVEHRHAASAAVETVLVAWDPARRVLWRKAPGAYLADHVERFTVEYFRADGRLLGPVDFTESGWPQTVARVSVTVSVTVDGRTALASRAVTLIGGAT